MPKCSKIATDKQYSIEISPQGGTKNCVPKEYMQARLGLTAAHRPLLPLPLPPPRLRLLRRLLPARP